MMKNNMKACIRAKLDKFLLMLKIKKSRIPKWSPEELSERMETLYLDVLPDVWDMKETEYHFQFYSFRAVKMCIEVIEEEGTLDFLDTLYLVCESWFRIKERNIKHNYKYKNPYSAFMIFLLEFSYKLKRLERKISRKRGESSHQRFIILLLTCIKHCLQKPLIENDEQIKYVLVILRKLASNRGTEMPKIHQLFSENTQIVLNQDIIEMLHLEINDVVYKLEYNL